MGTSVTNTWTTIGSDLDAVNAASPCHTLLILLSVKIPTPPFTVPLAQLLPYLSPPQHSLHLSLQPKSTSATAQLPRIHQLLQEPLNLSQKLLRSLIKLFLFSAIPGLSSGTSPSTNMYPTTILKGSHRGSQRCSTSTSAKATSTTSNISGHNLYFYFHVYTSSHKSEFSPHLSPSRTLISSVATNISLVTTKLCSIFYHLS